MDDYYLDVPNGIVTQQMMSVLAQAADSGGLYISDIGGYSRTKYPNSAYWHLRRQGNGPALLLATFWDVQSLLWLKGWHPEPQWVKNMIPILLKAHGKEVAAPWAGSIILVGI